jgi:hypothetical protein
MINIVVQARPQQLLWLEPLRQVLAMHTGGDISKRLRLLARVFILLWGFLSLIPVGRTYE